MLVAKSAWKFYQYLESSPSLDSPVQTRRADALTGFRIAPPLHEKETPGEAPGVEGFGSCS